MRVDTPPDAHAGAMDSNRLLRERGVARELAAHVVAACFGADDAWAAFALGDGTLRLVSCGTDVAWRTARAHEGGILSLAPDIAGGGFLTGGDDGLLRRTDADGEIATLADFKGKWVEAVAVAHSGQGLIACAAGRDAHLFAAAGARLRSWAHPSTVTGLAFDPRGKRLGASHYNGASLWFVNSDAPTPRRLEWKGSHIGIAIHPGNEAVVTSMQENALHGWRLADMQHMRMSGYPAKVESIAFTHKGRWLASSGAEAVVLWPFFAGGPMNKPPLELAPRAAPCTRVAAHPKQDMVAAGYADGMVLLVDPAAGPGSGRMLPVAAPAAGRGAVTALAWSHGGGQLAFGTERGFAARVDLSR